MDGCARGKRGLGIVPAFKAFKSVSAEVHFWREMNLRFQLLQLQNLQHQDPGWTSAS